MLMVSSKHTNYVLIVPNIDLFGLLLFKPFMEHATNAQVGVIS